MCEQNYVEAFKKAIEAGGIHPPAEIVPEGTIHRYHVEGDKASSKNGWYILHGNAPQAGAFGSWRQDISQSWCSKSVAAMSGTEMVLYTKRMETLKQQRESEREKAHAECRKKAKKLWREGRDVDGFHPYIINKNINPYGIKEVEESLIVPVCDASGELQGLQFIDPYGGKKFLTGTAVSGNYLLIGKLNGKVLVCEGYATGATLHKATGEAVAVAFNCGNLQTVAKALHEKLPETTLIICADDDWATEGNPGLTKATEAAKAVNGLLAVPFFPVHPHRGPKDTDFNDLFRLSGAEAVKAGVDGAKPVVQETPERLDEWGEPSLFGEIETEDIPCTILPGCLGDFSAAVSKAVQTPPGLAVMLCLAVVATAVQKKFEVAPYGDEYIEPLNIWTVTALEPGTRKTAVKSEVTRPLADWEQGKADELKSVIRDNNHAIDLAKKRIDNLKVRAAKPETTKEDREGLLKEISGIEEQTPKEIFLPRIWIDDVTPEKLQNLLADHEERMSLLSDEGGIFDVMAGLYSQGKFNINVFLQSHAGSPVRVDRQGRTVTLSKPALTFGMAIQPGVLGDLAMGNKSRFRSNGTLARFLYCLPKSTVGRRNMAQHTPVPEQVRSAYHTLIDSLLDIPHVYDENGLERARILTLDAEAKNAWIDFAQRVENRMGPEGNLSTIKDWAGKLPGAALRIAGLFHAAMYREEKASIDLQSMERAIHLAELLVSHAKAAFGMMGDDEIVADAKVILQWLIDKRIESFSLREALRRHEGRIKKVDRLRKALGELIDRQIISPVENIRTGRRPSKSHRVNPKIFEPEKTHFYARNLNDKIDKIDNIPNQGHFVDFVDIVDRGPGGKEEQDTPLKEDILVLTEADLQPELTGRVEL